MKTTDVAILSGSFIATAAIAAVASYFTTLLIKKDSGGDLPDIEADDPLIPDYRAKDEVFLVTVDNPNIYERMTMKPDGMLLIDSKFPGRRIATESEVKAAIADGLSACTLGFAFSDDKTKFKRMCANSTIQPSFLCLIDLRPPCDYVDELDLAGGVFLYGKRPANARSVPGFVVVPKVSDDIIYRYGIDNAESDPKAVDEIFLVVLDEKREGYREQVFYSYIPSIASLFPGRIIASQAQVLSAFEKGLSTCDLGWALIDNDYAASMRNRTAASNCSSCSIGIVNDKIQLQHAGTPTTSGVYLYGKRPKNPRGVKGLFVRPRIASDSDWK